MATNYVLVDFENVQPDLSLLAHTTFKVKVAIGLVYDFSDVGTLKKYISEKRVVPTDRVSFDGKTWTVLKEVGNLDDFFIDQWVRLKQEKLAEDQKPKTPSGPVFGEPKREPKSNARSRRSCHRSCA